MPETELEAVNLAVSFEQILANPPFVKGIGYTITLMNVSGEKQPFEVALIEYITVSLEALLLINGTLVYFSLF